MEGTSSNGVFAHTAGPAPGSYLPKVGLLERVGLRDMDGWMAFSALGLLICSIYTLSQTSAQVVAGAPDYFPQRQAVYGLVGIVAMIAIARIDYSRFRELRVGIYTFLCASILIIFAFGVTSRGSTQSLDLPFFSFQPAELGKLLLVLSLAGFVIDGARRGSEVAANAAVSGSRTGTDRHGPASGPRNFTGLRRDHDRDHGRGRGALVAPGGDREPV